MKKVISLAVILFVSVISTACINNLAVQDLNNKAQAYMEKGDYTSAIERLKSGIDLDPSIFETHYNLAVAYTMTEDYPDAIEEYNKALQLKPDKADIYCSLATAQNNLAVDAEQGKIRMNDDGTLYSPTSDEINFDEEYKMSEKEALLVSQMYEEAVRNYEKYLELNPKAADKKTVEAQINTIKNHINSSDRKQFEG